MRDQVIKDIEIKETPEILKKIEHFERNKIIEKLRPSSINNLWQEDYTPDEVRDDIVNAHVLHSDLLPKLSQRYKIAFFLFINNYEQLVDMTRVIDKENRFYGREIKVHYSIYNTYGELIYADVAQTSFPSKYRDIYEIISLQFPVISKFFSFSKYEN